LLAQPHVDQAVVLEEGAEATLVRETASVGREGAPALHAGAVELFVGEGDLVKTFLTIDQAPTGTEIK
jgi:hypothetical protein